MELRENTPLFPYLLFMDCGTLRRPNLNTLKVEITASFPNDFKKEDSIGSVLGFENVKAGERLNWFNVGNTSTFKKIILMFISASQV